MPQAEESWHAVLRPFRFSGETNWFRKANIELVTAKSDPEGPVAVMTSAGYQPESTDIAARGLDFINKVDEVREWYDTLDENVINGVFQIANADLDGMTLSIWKSDEALTNAACGRYGLHCKYLNLQKSEKLADRTSYIRSRILHSKGVWNGIKPAQSIC